LIIDEREFGIRKIDLLRSNTALNYKCILRIGFANGLRAKVRFNELINLAVRFNELLLLAPNSFVRVASASAEGVAETKLGVIEQV
jgi:hypothetical protein